MKAIEKTYAVNLTYSGFTYNTKAYFEYEHTGEYYIIKGNKNDIICDTIDKVKNNMKKHLKLFKSDGYYYIKRIAIPTTLADGSKSKWYINNGGDYYRINKVSKYGKKIHNELSEQKITRIWKFECSESIDNQTIVKKVEI